MEGIATVTGVPKATLYYYFEGKEEILTFLFVEILAEVRQAVTRATASPGSAAERLTDALKAHLSVFERFPAASRALQFDLGRAARIPLLAEQTETAFIEPIRQLLDEGRRDGSLRPTRHPSLLASAILGAVSTIGITGLTTKNPLAYPTVAAEMVSFVIDGIRA
jgi:TetR/AcrR family transcriptional regulator